MRLRAAVVLLLGLLIAAPARADQTLDAAIRERVEQLQPEAQRLRRQIHANPELCNQEYETARLVAEYLADLHPQTGLGGTGVKVVVQGGLPGPTVGVRADMDALPIEEATGLPFASRTKGAMHACGHDLHTANLLIAARVAGELRDRIPGTLVFLFQPCEEGAPAGQIGGAELLVQQGILEGLDAMVGLHVFPDLKVGQVGLREGPLMANVDFFYIDVIGRTAHGAYPHQGIDAIWLASMAIQQFHGLISRLRDPVDPAVLTVGRIQGGERVNVLAGNVRMEGTVRTFSRATQDLVEKGMGRILQALKDTYGGEFALKYEKVAPFLDNDAAAVRRVAPALAAAGAEVVTLPPQTIGEDFAFYSQRVPSVFFFLGVGPTSGLHTPTFNPAEEALRLGPVLLLQAALHAAPPGSPPAR